MTPQTTAQSQPERTNVMDKIELVYGTTPKKDRARIEKQKAAAIAEIVSRHLPRCTLKMWVAKTAGQIKFAPKLARIYIDKDGQSLGYIEVRRSPRKPKGRYETHRWTKGEDQYDVAIASTLTEAMKTSLDAAVLELLDRTDQTHRWGDDDQFEYTYGALA